MQSHRTADRGPPGQGQGQVMAVHTVHQIGPNRQLLPNGNLLCTAVPIARSGWLLYGPGEVPVKPGANGIVYIERKTEDLFNPLTMASFNAAALTNDHPTDDVTPLNWNGLAGGFAINVRQGTGDDADVLLADLMVTNKDLIDALQKGKIEVSAGYDADYVDLGDGFGRQSNIIGNHIALVEKGRCGPRCAIGDNAFFVPPPLSKETPMSTRTPLRQSRVPLVDEAAKEAARQKVRDAQLELEALEEAGEEGNATHVHIHNYGGDATKPPADGSSAGKTLDAATEERFVKLEGGLDEIKALIKGIVTKDAAAPEEDDEEMEDDGKGGKRKKTKAGTGDSAALATSYTTLASQAEILQPGFKVPTFDAAATRAQTVDRMCNVRRKVLDAFGATTEGAAMLLAANGGQPVDLLTMDCATCATLFTSAAAAKAAANNASATRDSARMAAGTGVMNVDAPKLPSPADFNKAAQDFWKGQ